jgi:tagaturonate reductase
MQSLSRTTVSNLEENPVKVLQFGSGNFLRGFADWIIDVMNEKGFFHGNVEIVQSVSSSKENGIQLQDGLYHVAIKGMIDNGLIDQLRLITSVSRTFNATEEPDRFYSCALNPNLRFVISNTTEAGIVFREEPFIAGGIPTTFPGKLTIIFLERFKKGLPGLIVLPCELIEKNGEVLRDRIVQYINYWALPKEFERWVIEQCIFCNTLVDRIIPGGSRSLVEEVAERTGYIDEIPVAVEPYYFWAIEAPAVVKEEFPADACGLNVRFVSDLGYFRERKVRILNGGHTAMMPVAYLLGLRTVKECLLHEKIKSFLHAVLFEEIIPTLKGDQVDLRNFANDVLQRFANPFVEHQLASIALNSVAKFRVRLLPTVLEYHKATGDFPKHLIHSLAALIVFYRGHWKGQIIPVNDDRSVTDFFKDVWEGEEKQIAVRVLGNTALWGTNLTEIPGMVNAVASELDILLLAASI